MPPPKQDQEIEKIDEAIAHFQQATGLLAIREATRMLVLQAGDQKILYRIAYKSMVDRVATLLHVKERLQAFSEPGLLIAPYISVELASQCRKIGLQFLDAAGNAFLNESGILIFLQGMKPAKEILRRERPMRAFDYAGLKVVFCWLAKPELLQASYREVAKAAGVSPATVGWVLDNLKEHGFLVEGKQGVRRWIDKARTQEAWCMNFPLRLRGKLHPRRYRALDANWWQEAQPLRFGGCWSGEVAAAKLIGELVPRTATLYFQKDRKAFLNAHRLRMDPEGDIEILDAFWDWDMPEDLAPSLLVYADLEHIGDPRTIEQARVIHETHLA